MKTQTQTETETEAETKTGVHQQPQHALVAGARTFIWPWPMAQCLIRLRVQLRVRVGQAGAPRTHRCTSTSTSMAIVLEASLARINFRPTLFTVCSAWFSLCSARVCSLSELSARGFPASILGSGSSRVRPSGATFTFDFYGQQRQLALNFSSSFIVYAFTYAAHVPPLFWHTLSPFLWHLARFLFKIHNCRRQRRVIVGEFATPCCLDASRLPPFSLLLLLLRRRQEIDHVSTHVPVTCYVTLRLRNLLLQRMLSKKNHKSSLVLQLDQSQLPVAVPAVRSAERRAKVFHLSIPFID